MSKLIRLYQSNMFPVTGDVFTILAHFYSEDNDIKDTTGNNWLSQTIGIQNKTFFQNQGYTTGDPTSTAAVGQGGRNPLKYPRQFYIKNDQSGSIDSDFVNELEKGDVIHLISGHPEGMEESFIVSTTACVDCSANIVRIESKDTDDSDGDYNDRHFKRTYIDDAGNTQTPNYHATKGYYIKNEDVNNSVFVQISDISTYEKHPVYRSEMLVTFKEGVFPKGGHVVLKDITHTGALNDIVIDASGYTGEEVKIKIEIDSTTNPETFKWRFGNYIEWTSPASAYAEEQRGLSLQFIPLNLGNGEIKVKWLATTGHTTDTWTFTVYPNSKRVYKNQIPELDKIYK